MIEPKPNSALDEPRTGEPAPAAGDSFPTACERPVGGGWSAWIDHWGLRQTRMWWLTGACVVVAVVLVATAWHSSGPRVTIEFVEGHGLRPGDAVRLRGIDVGIVERVVLNDALDRVEVTAELMQEASAIAREGTLFWIERPQVELSAVRGLDTVVGPKYIAVQPGPRGNPRAVRFAGVEAPRQFVDAGDGLEVTLESDTRNSLQTGSPVIYRGVPIGRVTHVGLASDAASVEARVYIESEYLELVRDNSKFWPISGVDVRLGFTGVELAAESLATITTGGVAMATPDEPSKRVAAGHRFRLEAKADSRWLEWRPHLPIGVSVRPDREPVSVRLRGTFSWPRKTWGVTRTQQQRTWVHPLAEGKLLCALDLGEGESLPDGTIFEIEGQKVPLTTENIELRGSLAVISGVKLPHPPAAWKAQQMRQPSAPEDCVLVSGTESWPVAESRLQAGKMWVVDVSVPLTPDWHGAGVISRADGALIGLVIWHDGTALVAPWTETAPVK
jgi:hypothetical protein